MRALFKYLIFFCTAAFSGKAQHFQFSQFYAAPTHLNPAFTGAGVCGRFTLNYRNQWAGIGQFTTYQMSLDHYVRKMKSGLGVQMLKDIAGPANLTTTQWNLLYAYQVQINKKIAARAGLSAGIAQRALEPDRLVFSDQIERGEGARTAENFTTTNVTYADIGTGVLVYAREFWGGIAFSHLNRPDQSMVGGNSRLPTEIRVHGGYKFILEESGTSTRNSVDNHHITVAANFKKQAKFNQFDVGVYYNKNLIVLGAWYRGIPVRKPVPGYENNDAFVMLIGFALKQMKVGYTYDMTLSGLSNARTRGTHEISLSWELCKQKGRGGRRKKNVLISCPKF